MLSKLTERIVSKLARPYLDEYAQRIFQRNNQELLWFLAHV